MRCAMTRRGFTLVEILMVVVILGIASALVIPQISSRDDLKVAAASRLLMADLAYAQNQAITTQRMQYVRFVRAASADTYTLYDGSVAAANIADHPVSQTPFIQSFGPSSPRGIDTVRIGNVNIDGSGTTETIAFDSLGSPHSLSASTVPLAAAATVQFTTPRGASMTVRIEPYTGELSVTEP